MHESDRIMSNEDRYPPQFAPRHPPARPSAIDARRIGNGRPSTSVRPTSSARMPRPVAQESPPVEVRPPVRRPPGTPRPELPVTATPERPRSTPRTRPGRRPGKVVAVVVALLLAWPVGLLVWANGKVHHTSALSGGADSPGTTYLLVGSDSRADGTIADGTEGQRSDSILLLHSADNGRSAMVSLPRDTYVQIDGYGANKLNTAFAFGGAPLLVSTVENLTGITVDHYVEVGMGGVVSIVDAVGGINLCLDYDVDDELSELTWIAGCHDVDGTTALAFARMRYSDPLGDIGRQARQRQVIAAVVRKAATPSSALNPVAQVRLIDAGTTALTTDDASGIVDLGRLALTFRSATGEDGLTGTPPIADFDHRPGGVGSTVLLDPVLAPEFFSRLRDGHLEPADVD